MLALLAGATSVFACEMSKPMVDVARRVLSDNKMEEKILLINKISTDILVDHDIPQQKVSLVISEIMDAGLYGEGILPTLLDAKKRLLRPGGILIPNRAKIYGMLVQSDEIRRSVSVKSSRNSQYPVLVSEYTQEAVRLSSSGDPYVSEYMSKTPFTPLSRNFQLDEICFNDLNSLEQHSDNFNLTLTIPVTTAGRLDGVVSWFEVELYDGITLQTGIGTDTMWEQAVYPCGREINVLPNSSVNLQVRLCAKNRLELLVVDADHNDGQLQVAKTALIRKMNDLKLFDFYQNSFNTADVIPELLDLSDLPMVSELALKRGWKTTVITDSEELFEACLKDRLPTEALKNVTINSSEYIEHLSSPVSLITVDLADSMGTLKPKCLEDLAFCRLKLGVEAVVPSKLTVYGKLVESSELWGWTCVTDDRNTLGLKIRDRINVFQTNLQLDVPKGISREFKGLSEAQQLLQLDLCEKLLPNSESLPKFVKQDAKVTMQVTDGGQLHAVLLWFQYQSGPAVLDTLQAESFHQAAYMLDGTTVSQGFNVELLVNLANSEIAVELVK